MRGLWRLPAIALRRPRLALAVWGVVMVGLAIAGSGVEDRLAASNASAVSGTEAGDAAEIKEQRLDEEVMFVMLRGPQGEVDRQGAALAQRLAAEPGTHVLAPWPPSPATAPLKPRNGVAGLMLSIEHRPGEVFLDFVPRTEKIVRDGIEAPVQEHVAGAANVGEATVDAALEAGSQSEKIAAPVLLLVLLLVFGSAVAAAVPAVMGLSTVAAGYGVLALLSEVTVLHPVGATLSAMLGLALGVDYSLLLVSRFREELDTGKEPREAAEGALATAGRTVLFAGAALIAAMTIMALLAPGDVILAGAIAVIVATVLSVVTALFVVPAALTLIGRRIDRWRVPLRRTKNKDEEPRVPALARIGLKRPLAVAASVVLGLTLAGAGGFALKTSPPTSDLLSPDARITKDFERIENEFGPGFEATYEILVDDRTKPLTDGRTLEALTRFETDIRSDPEVAFVVGPAALEAANADRNRLSVALDVADGGKTGRVLVVPRTGIRSQRSRDLNERLQAAARTLERDSGVTARVGGFASGYREYDDRTRDRIPLIVLALAAMTFVVLVLLLRSILWALVAAVLNVVTVGVTFACLALLFNTGFLGGPGYTDTFTAASIITVIFGLAIDYEVFILARVREEFLQSGDTEQAIVRGLAATGRIVTGAALIMIAVFLSFGTSDFMTIRQFGVGLAIAVAIDAFVIRLVALPALMRLLADRAWWLPSWLDARLPTARAH